MFALGVVGMVLFAAVDTGLAWLVKKFLDGAFVERDPQVLVLVPAGIIVLFTVRGIGDFLAVFAPGWVGRHVIKAIRRDLFARYLQLPTAFFDRSGVAQLLSRLTYNIELVAEAATTAITSLIRDSLTIIGLLGWLFFMNWRLTTFALAVAPLIVGLMRVTSRLFRRYSMRIQASMGDVTRVAKEALESHRMIKVFNAQPQQHGSFEQVNERNRTSFMKLVAVKAVSSPVVQLIAAFGLAAVMYVAIRDVLEKGLSVGEFTSFLTALLLITAPLRRLVSVVGPLQQGIAAAQSIFEVIDSPAEPVGGDRPIERARGDVEYRDVRFRYPAGAEDVLNGVTFKVRAGQTVAIVGRSGSGKSTIVSLLPRFYDLTAGSLLLDGHDIREYPLPRLRAQMSLVSQDVVLFNDTIRSNIAFGFPASHEQIEAAARAARVNEFADQMPDGLDTEVGDRGTLLSGGQRQRIAIARALLRNSPILILDEATSALDTETERQIQEQLEGLMKDRTTLVIAHRLSTVEKADRILVMEGGRLIENGTHEELLARNGQYAVLYRLQFNE